jgi:predicted nuclease of predicted toxin-antitoxin system
VKFLIDMPLSPGLADLLQRQGHDAVHALTLGMDRSADIEIMARAVVEYRTVVPADLYSPRLLALTGATGPSLILFRGGDWSEAEVTTRMSGIVASLSEADIGQSILVVERNRVRRRRLPIG